MDDEGVAWEKELHHFIQQARAVDPLPDRSCLDKAQEMQCRILGGSLITWLDHVCPRLLADRKTWWYLRELEPDPYLVFETTLPGLVAAAEILEGGADRLIFLSPEEYRDWTSQNPDPAYRWHVHTYSFFCDGVTAESLGPLAARFPLPPGAVYWKHVQGDRWGERCGRGVEHLWSWDGEEPELLEEAFNDWVE